METKENLSCLRQLLDEDSNRMISGEVKLKNSLQEWINMNSAPSLKIVMRRYTDMIARHITDLEIFCEEEQIRAINISNKVMNTLIDEVNEKLANCACSQVKDACLLASLQTICHFKISAYGTATAFAGAAGLDKIAALFHRAETDEKSIDEELSHLAAHEINIKALAPIVLGK